MPRKKPKVLNLETRLGVTSVRVHPKVMKYVKEMCEAANLSFNQLLILGISVLHEEPVYKKLVEANRSSRKAMAAYQKRMQEWRDVSRIGPPGVTSRELAELVEETIKREEKKA